MPKRLRPYFMYDRKILAKLSLCAWNVLSRYLETSISAENHAAKVTAKGNASSPMHPGCVIAVQTFGEFLNFNPHLHIIATDGCFHDDGRFIKSATPVAADLEQAFAAEVFGMLVKEDKISIDQERMTYIPEQESSYQKAKVIYEGKTSKSKETFSALDFLARLVTHIPDKGEQMVRYYGYYSIPFRFNHIEALNGGKLLIK